MSSSLILVLNGLGRVGLNVILKVFEFWVLVSEFESKLSSIYLISKICYSIEDII